MRKAPLLRNSTADGEELEDLDADLSLSRRHGKRAQHARALPELDDSTAAPSGSSSNQQSKRPSGQSDEGTTIFPRCMQSDPRCLHDVADLLPQMQPERRRDVRPKRRLVTDSQSPLEISSWPSVLPDQGRRKGTCSESEPESERSLGHRSSSMCSVGSSFDHCRSAASSSTPRLRRPRSRSGSEARCLAQLRDHLHDHMPYPDMLGRSTGSSSSKFPPLTPPGTPGEPLSPVSPTASLSEEPRARNRMFSSASASAFLASAISDGSPDRSLPLCSNARGNNRQRQGKATVDLSQDDASLGTEQEVVYHVDRHSVKLPPSHSRSFPSSSSRATGLPEAGNEIAYRVNRQGARLPLLTHSASAPLITPTLHKSHASRSKFKEAALEEEDLEVMDLEPLGVTVARNFARPTTAWGASRPRTTGREGESPKPARRAKGDRDGWQLSLCQRVAIHCPSSLPSKATFAQRKVPRPVSPLPTGDSPPATPIACAPDGSVPLLQESIGSLLQNMRRLSSRSSSRESECGPRHRNRSNSEESAVEIS